MNNQKLSAGIERLITSNIGKLFPVQADAAKVRELCQRIRCRTAYNERVAAFQALTTTLDTGLLKTVLNVMAGLVVALLIGIGQVQAGQFGLIDLAAPQTFGGTFISMDGTGSAGGAAVAVVTHKAKVSNNVLRAFIAGWVPLAVGGTMGAGLGGPSIAAGTGLNLLPAARAGLLGVISALAKPGALASLQGALQAQDSPVALFVGPQYNLVFSAPNQSKGKPTWFVGFALNWE